MGTEICDDGVLNDNQGCTTDCLSVLPGYSCTSGSTTSPSICVLGCGNSLVDPPGELCDDGNQIDFDGCNAAC